MIRPLGNQVLIQEMPPQDRSRAGIMFPASYQREAYEFIVRAKGPKADEGIGLGDKIVLDQYRLNSRTAAGPGLWLIPDHSINVVIPLQMDPSCT